VRLLASIPLLFHFLVLGTGIAAHVHTLDHQRQDAAGMQSDGCTRDPIHDDTNCRIHAQLHMPMVAAGWAPPLVSVGVLVVLVTLLPGSLLPQFRVTPFNSRGPPTLQPG
jgi:hypothetical protein